MIFGSLPLEILQYIAVCVEAGHRPSLHAFSLSSKVCHEAALFLIFRQISITVQDRQGLRHDIERLTEALSRTQSFRHIQRITLKGGSKFHDKRVECWAPKTPWFVYSGLSEILHEEEPICYSSLYSVYDEAVIVRSSEEDMAWTPVVNLIQATPQLKDLIYDCQCQFPPNLLRALHEDRPQCRLHHLTFKFRTLLWGAPYPYEIELATSPSLYRLKVLCANRDSHFDDDFNLEAMMELTTGLAPNLREVTILNLQPGGSLRPRRPRALWSGLPGFTRGNRGSLTSLSIKGSSRLTTPEVLQTWVRHIDFACLQQLTLGGNFSAFCTGLSGETMEWITQTQSLPRVKMLKVWLTRDDVLIERPHYSDHAASFFQHFDSLEQLVIHGAIDSRIVNTVLYYHGQTLKKLHLDPFEENYVLSNGRDRKDIPFEFTKDRILQIEAQCSALEELAIPIKRSKSSASEAELYKCLGGMENLQSLFLVLNCSNWRVARDPTYNPEFNEEDQKPFHNPGYSLSLAKGELRDTFINCAVDETLACSIWKTISQNKIGRRLERLRLWTTGAGEYGAGYGVPVTFLAMARNLSRSWLLERIPRDDKEDFTVKELGQAGRQFCDQRDSNYVAYGHNPDIWKIFRSIWPSPHGIEGWEDDWSSFPLQNPSSS